MKERNAEVEGLVRSVAEEDLTTFERKVYEFIRRSGELLTTNIPLKMRGAVPNLVGKGLVEVYKRRTSLWSSKKRKFLRAKSRKTSGSSIQKVTERNS